MVAQVLVLKFDLVILQELVSEQINMQALKGKKNFDSKLCIAFGIHAKKFRLEN